MVFIHQQTIMTTEKRDITLQPRALMVFGRREL
jgi:hypothetical protein